MANAESVVEAVKIDALIKQFSSSGIPINDNTQFKKPNPLPRRKSKTTEIQRPTSLGLPVKPAVTTKPLPSPRQGLSPNSLCLESKPKPATKPRPASGLDFSKTNEINLTQNSSVTKPIPAAKPSKNLVLETKPINKNNGLDKTNSDQKTLKINDPPKIPPPILPTTKPVKYKEIPQQHRYENLKENKIIRNQENSINTRHDTLDGVAFGGNRISDNETKAIYLNNIKSKSTYDVRDKSSTLSECPNKLIPTQVYSSVENDDSYDYPFNPNDHQNSINISSKKNNSEKAKGYSSDESDDDYDYPFDPNDPQNNIKISSEKKYSEKVKGYSSDENDDDSYDYPFDPNGPQNNIEKNVSPDCLKKGVSYGLVNVDSDEIYVDPNGVDFSGPPCVIKKNPVLSSSSNDFDRQDKITKQQLSPNCSVKISSSDDDDSDPYDVPLSESPERGAITEYVQEKSVNNLISSSDDDDDNYTDPESIFIKPPSTLKCDSLGRSTHFSPEQYMPTNVNDEFMGSSTYIDPAQLFDISPVNSANKSTEKIYSDEPLYQVYTAKMLEDFRRESKKSNSDDNEDLDTSNDYKNLFKGAKSAVRLLWAEIPEVCKSGILNRMDPNERKRQEAMFEVITSEASYLKSLDILVSHFMMSKVFLPNPNLPSTNPNEFQLIDRQQYHFLFSGVSAVKSVSERFLKALRQRQQENVLLNSISDIILEFANSEFNCYIKYCSNQVFQDRTFQALLNSSPQFAEALAVLEAHPKCQGLNMHSFITMPMQRITRLPLLVDAIIRRCEPQSEEYYATDKALKAINVVVYNSNEGARKMERTEEMYYIQKTLVFKTKPIPLISTSRWLLKKGLLSCLHDEGRFSKYKNQLRQIFKGKCKSIYLFLFTDLILITKMKSEGQFKVIDYCQRSLLKIEELKNIPNQEPSRVGTLQTIPLKYAFTLVLLENCNNKTVEYHCFLDTTTAKTRWLEAFCPNQSQVPDIEGEAIYDDFDCPQVQVIHPYQAEQSDEISLFEGDVLKVLRKLPDGWCEGMRLRDDQKGWFPINHTLEIDSKHMRAKNLMQRYRLLYASQNIIATMSK